MHTFLKIDYFIKQLIKMFILDEDHHSFILMDEKSPEMDLRVLCSVSLNFFCMKDLRDTYQPKPLSH